MDLVRVFLGLLLLQSKELKKVESEGFSLAGSKESPVLWSNLFQGLSMQQPKPSKVSRILHLISVKPDKKILKELEPETLVSSTVTIDNSNPMTKISQLAPSSLSMKMIKSTKIYHGMASSTSSPRNRTKNLLFSVIFPYNIVTY